MKMLKDTCLLFMLGTLGLALALTLATPAPSDAAHGNHSDGKGRRHGGDRINNGSRGGGGGVGMPELDPGAMAGALTLLAGGAAIAIERRRSFNLHPSRPSHDINE